MARYTHEQAEQDVKSVLLAGGGTVTHNELVSALEAQNKTQAVNHLLTLQANGAIKAQVVAVSAGTNELRYSLPVQGGA